MSYHNIDKMKEEIEKAEKENNEVMRLTALLPDFITKRVDRVYYSNSLPDWGCLTVKIKTDTLQEAIELSEKGNAEQIMLMRFGWARFIPECSCDLFMSNYPQAEHEATPNNCSIYKLEGLYGHAETKTLTFWMNLEPENGVESLVRVEVQVANDPDHYRRYDLQQFRGGQRVENTHGVSKAGIFTRQLKWGRGSDDHPNAITYY